MGRLNAGRKRLRTGLSRFGRHLQRAGAAYAVLVISLLLTALASWYYVRQSVEAQNRARFDETTRAAKAAIYRRMTAKLNMMLGARALLRVSDSVGQEEWDGYVDSIEPWHRDRVDGLQALGFAKYVVPAKEEDYSRKAREEGERGLWPEPDGDQPAYFPMKFVAPLHGANRRMINYDSYSDPAYRPVMDRARDIGLPQATRMIYVLTNSPPHDLISRKGFVVYLPVYQEGEPQDTVAERRHALRGFVVGIFRADELFAGTFGPTFHPAIDIEVYDGAEQTSNPLLYDSNGVKHTGEKENAAFVDERHMNAAGIQAERHKWDLVFATEPESEEGTKSSLPVFALLSGVAVSFLLFGITLMLVRSRTQAFRASADLKVANRELEEANAELQRSREILVSAREEERRRLRRELHDGVGPKLVAVMLGLETASDLVSDNAGASALIAKLSERAREIVSDVRRSAHDLRPPALDELGLVEALREEASQYASAGLLVSVESPEELSNLPAAAEVACYRIVQEAMTNVVRHSGASHCSVRIRLEEDANALLVEVEDDGRGIRNDDRAGVGVSSMRERTEELGGWCTVTPSAGGGTLVKAFLPLRTAADETHREG